MTRIGLIDTDKRRFFIYRQTTKTDNKSVEIRSIGVIRVPFFNDRVVSEMYL
jgi:hypothetical protein